MIVIREKVGNKKELGGEFFDVGGGDAAGLIPGCLD